ncbi:hypothetical protein [Sorangium sp. So ce861]|uniref:hypothetical protein n=1 Tax=Sorangium sp. So ce861 TaxID=3133323 RepID=UPI003F6126BE
MTIGTNIERSDPEKRRPTSQNPLWISYEDCVGNNGLVFSLDFGAISTSSSETLAVWVSEGGTDCTDPRNRQPGELCRQVDSWAISAENVNTKGMTVDLEAKKIAAALGAEGCNDSMRTGTGAVSMTLYFLRLAGLDVEPEDSVTWGETKMDLKGPNPPTGVEAGAGDGRLLVDFKQNEDPDVRGYYLYCDANATSSPGGTGAGEGSGGSADSAGGAGGAGGATGAGGAGGATGAGGAGGATGAGGAGGATGAGGASGATGAGGASGGSGGENGGAGEPGGGDAADEGSSSCQSAVLAPGEIPDSAYRCGSLGRTGAGEAGGLRNGNSYVVGVAAYDIVGNAGPLSELACGTPIDVDGFFELYREAGGQAGGGFCSVEGPVGASRWVSWPLGALATGAALGMWRRSRRRRARSFTQENG